VRDQSTQETAGIVAWAKCRLMMAVVGGTAMVFAGTAVPQPAIAATANCRNTINFDRWLADFKKEAAAKGISPRAIAAAAPYLRYDQRIINIDRGQRFFAQDFLKFSDRTVVKYRITRGAQLVKKHAKIFAAVEREYGVPAPVIVAFWALESDFGSNMGKDRVLPSLTTLAYDCRRSEMFRGHLFDALRVIERGDLRPDEMIGSWAGELGQTQFMPSEYLRNAVDYDGNGKRDLLKSVPDMLASTGKYLVHLGWRRGEPWLEEVRVPNNMPWDQADLDIKHPRSQWRKWGVTRASGRPLPADNLPASLVLPMGRYGPAFLAYNNFQAYLQWNNSLVYSISAAYLATRIAGAPPMNRGRKGIPVLSFNETRELQQLLVRRGHDVGRIDGLAGSKTRDAVKAEQKKLGLPADSYPTPELLARLRQGK
jgi:lytic murein transglycosylase